jgi:hypothetical protein
VFAHSATNLKAPAWIKAKALELVRGWFRVTRPELPAVELIGVGRFPIAWQERGRV